VECVNFTIKKKNWQIVVLRGAVNIQAAILPLPDNPKKQKAETINYE